MRIAWISVVSREIIGVAWHYVRGSASILGPSRKELCRNPRRNCRRKVKPKPFNPDLPDRRPGLSATSACPRLPPGLTGPSSPGDPPAFVGGIISHPASGRTGDRLGPRVLRSAGFVLPPHPRYYDPIRGSRRLPRISQWGWLYRGASPDDVVWAAAEIVLTLSHPPFPACRYPYAGGNEGTMSRSSPITGLRPGKLGSAPSSLLPPASWQARVSTHQYSRYAAARRVARLSTRSPPSRGGRDFYVRAFPARVAPRRSRI
jgi:hypothetical protein